jgi:hypothetical protein
MMKRLATPRFPRAFCFKHSVSSLKFRLGWHLQERKKVRDTQADWAASCNGIRECIWHQISCKRMKKKFNVGTVKANNFFKKNLSNGISWSKILLQVISSCLYKCSDKEGMFGWFPILAFPIFWLAYTIWQLFGSLLKIDVRPA